MVNQLIKYSSQQKTSACAACELTTVQYHQISDPNTCSQREIHRCLISVYHALRRNVDAQKPTQRKHYVLYSKEKQV